MIEEIDHTTQARVAGSVLVDDAHAADQRSR